MARRITSITTQTPAAYADATGLADATYPFLLRGGSATQRNDVYEVTFGGQAAASSVCIIYLGMDSTVGTGTNSLGAGQHDTPTDGSTAALAAPALVGNTNATVDPQRSSTLHLYNMSFNAYGGISRVGQANADRPIVTIIGASANTGEMSVSAFTGGGGGPIGGYMVYETW